MARPFVGYKGGARDYLFKKTYGAFKKTFGACFSKKPAGFLALQTSSVFYYLAFYLYILVTLLPYVHCPIS